jgi:hypothetical protein
MQSIDTSVAIELVTYPVTHPTKLRGGGGNRELNHAGLGIPSRVAKYADLMRGA